MLEWVEYNLSKNFLVTVLDIPDEIFGDFAYPCFELNLLSKLTSPIHMPLVKPKLLWLVNLIDFFDFLTLCLTKVLNIVIRLMFLIFDHLQIIWLLKTSSRIRLYLESLNIRCLIVIFVSCICFHRTDLTKRTYLTILTPLVTFFRVFACVQRLLTLHIHTLSPLSSCVDLRLIGSEMLELWERLSPFGMLRLAMNVNLTSNFEHFIWIRVLDRELVLVISVIVLFC